MVKKCRICRSAGNLTDLIPIPFFNSKKDNLKETVSLIADNAYGNKNFGNYSEWDLGPLNDSSTAIQRINEVALNVSQNSDNAVYSK